MNHKKRDMPYSDVVAPSDSRITLDSGSGSKSVDLYSKEGLDFIAALWVKLSAEFRLMYQPTWLGIPIVQFPEDIVVMQELIWRLRPDFVIECGVAHGGSAILYASLCELLGNGLVIGIDVEIRPHNRSAIEKHVLSKRIELIEGSSIDDRVSDEARKRVADARSVMVILDSNHSRQHVARELDVYSPLVTPGSYIVVMDGAQGDVWDIPRGKKEWKEDNPLSAIREFLLLHPEFEIDAACTRMHITSSPMGFLRRTSV